MKENSGSTRLVWADITPELSLLMLVQENVFQNKRVASIRRVDGQWKVVHETKYDTGVEVQVVNGMFNQKIDAMEHAIARHVAYRLDQANGGK